MIVTASARRKGQRAERDAVAALRALGLDAATSRSLTGGLQRGADVHCPTLPLAIEVKDHARDALPQWLDQARAQASEDRPGAVVHKRRGKADAAEWFVTLQLGDLVRLLTVTREVRRG